MTDPDIEQSGATGAAKRAAGNTTIRAVGELVGKIASLALLAILAREVGASGLGIFVFALAWCELALVPIEMGFDRYVLRMIAADKSSLERLFANTFAIKLIWAVPVVAVSWTLANLTVGDPTTRTTIYLLTAALLLESLGNTLTSVFNAFERGGLVAGTLVTQRLLAAALGVSVLALGGGVATVALTFAASAAVRLVLALWLLGTRIRWPGVVLNAETRRDLRRASLPYATQDLFAVGIARADTIIIAALATQAIVGLYGAAYRLLEATLFISSALAGAFAAMFTYLDEDSDPPIRPVFERALKATLALLVPCGVVLGVLAEPVLRAFFGGDFAAGADALRVLAGAVVMLGVARIASSLVVSRGGATRLVPWFGGALALNVALNLALVPPFDAAGAAAAMLVTQVLLAGAGLGLAAGMIGRVTVLATIAAPGLAGAAMAGAMWPMRDALLPALPVGVVAYLAVFVVVERIVSPVDLRFMVDLARRRLPSRAAA